MNYNECSIILFKKLIQIYYYKQSVIHNNILNGTMSEY